jgi:acyl-CoA-binding protein
MSCALRSSIICAKVMGRSQYSCRLRHFNKNCSIINLSDHRHPNNLPIISAVILIAYRSISSTSKEKTEEIFDKAVRFLQAKQSEKTGRSVSNEDKLVIYGLFKQATHGPSSSSETGRPGMFDMIGRAKFDAWSACDGLSRHDCMEKYINKIQDILHVSRQEIENFNTTASTPTAVKPAAKEDGSRELSLKDIFYPRNHGEGSYQQLSLPTILTSIDDKGVAMMTLNRPNRGNAFNFPMWKDYRAAFQAIQQDSTCRVVVLTGAPGSQAFSTGMDLDVFAELPQLMSKEPCEGRRREALGHFIQYLQDAVSEPERSPVPVIAKIAGHCIGGALDVITACDLRYCTNDSSFSIKETDLAMVSPLAPLHTTSKSNSLI